MWGYTLDNSKAATEALNAGDTQTELTRCVAGGPAPCWYTYDDAAACPGGDHVGIAISRGDTTAPANSRIQATCFAK